MRKLSIGFIFICSILFINCPEHKDIRVQTAILGYIANCTGGTLASCTDSCSSKYGDPVTNSNYQNISTCQAMCSNYCNLGNITLYYTTNSTKK